MEIKKFDRFLFTALGPDLVRRRWATSVTVNVCDGLVFEPVVSVPGCDCFTVSAGWVGCLWLGVLCGSG